MYAEGMTMLVAVVTPPFFRVCVCVCVFVCMCVHMCVHVCRGHDHVSGSHYTTIFLCVSVNVCVI